MAQITAVDITGPPRMDVTVNPVLESVRPFFQGLPANPLAGAGAGAAAPVAPPQHGGFPPASTPASYWPAPARAKTPPHSAKSPALASPLHHHSLYNGATKIGEPVQPQPAAAAQHSLPPIAALAGYQHSRHRALPAPAPAPPAAAAAGPAARSPAAAPPPPAATAAQPTFRAPEYPHHGLYSPNSASNHSHRSGTGSPYQTAGAPGKHPPHGSPAASSLSPHAYSYSPRTSLPAPAAAATPASPAHPHAPSAASPYARQPTPQPPPARPPSDHQSHYPMSPVIQQPNQELQHLKMLQQQASRQSQPSAGLQAGHDPLTGVHRTSDVSPSPVQHHPKQISSQNLHQQQQQEQQQQHTTHHQQQYASHLSQSHAQSSSQQPLSHLQQSVHHLTSSTVGFHQSLSRTEQSNEHTHHSQKPSSHHQTPSNSIHQYPSHLQNLSSVVQQPNQHSSHPFSSGHGPPQHSTGQQQSNHPQHQISQQPGHQQHSSSHNPQHSSYQPSYSQRLNSHHSSIQSNQPQQVAQPSLQPTHHHSSQHPSYPHHPNNSHQPNHLQQSSLQQSQSHYSSNQQSSHSQQSSHTQQLSHSQHSSQHSSYSHLIPQQSPHLHQSAIQPLHHSSYQQAVHPQHSGSHQSSGHQVHSPRSSQLPSPSQQPSRHQTIQPQHQRHSSLSDLKQAGGYQKHLLQQHQQQQQQQRHQQQSSSQQQQAYYSQQSDAATAAKLAEMQHELRIKQRQLAAVQAQQQAYYAAAATSSSARPPAQTVTTIEASSQQRTATTQAHSLAGGVKRESPLDLSVKTVRQSADSTAKDDSESVYLSHFQNQDVFHRNKSHIKTTSPRSPAILPPLQQPSAVAYPQFESSSSNNQPAASGMPKVDFLPNFNTHHTSSSVSNHQEAIKREKNNSSSQLLSPSQYPSQVGTLPHMGSFKKSATPSSSAYSDPNKPTQYYPSSGHTQHRSTPLMNHSSNLAAAPVSTAHYAYDATRRAASGRYDFLERRTSTSSLQSTSSNESIQYSLGKRQSTTDNRYHLPPKIPKGVDTWRVTIDQQIEQRLNSYASSRGHQINGTKDGLNKEPTLLAQTTTPYTSTPSQIIQSSHGVATLPSGNSSFPGTSLFSSQRTNSTSKLALGQYYPGQPQYHHVPPQMSHDPYAYPKLTALPSAANTAAEKERVLSILRKRLDTREATNQLIQQQLIHHQDRSKMYGQTHALHPYPQQPAVPSPLTSSQAKPVPQTPVGRHNLPPFTALSLERNPPNAYATQKLHLPKAMDSVAFDHPSASHNLRVEAPFPALPSRTEALAKPTTRENGADFDGLAAFLAARIRTKAELKQVGPSVDQQRSSNSASGSNSSAHSPRATTIFSPPPQGIHSQTALPPDFGKGTVTPSSESDRASSSGFSSSSPMKGSRDRYGINSPRRRLFCRPYEEGGGESVIQAREAGLRSSSETSVFDFRDSDSDGEAGPRLEDLRKDRQNTRRLQEKHQPPPVLSPLENPVGDIEPIEDSFWSGMCEQFVTQLQKGGNKFRKKGRRKKWSYTTVEEPILMIEQYDEVKYETITSEALTIKPETPELIQCIKVEKEDTVLAPGGAVLEVKKEVTSDEIEISKENIIPKETVIKEETPLVEETVQKVEAKLLPELKIVLRRPDVHVKKETESSDEDAPLAKRQNKLKRLKLLSEKFKIKHSKEKAYKKTDGENRSLSSDHIKKEDVKKETKKVIKKEYFDSEIESSADESFDAVRKSKRRGRKPKDEASDNRRKTRSSEKENTSTPRKVARKKKDVTVKPVYGDGSEFKPGWEAEVYRYKRSLRMPARLINIAGPQSWPRQSASLPDLDPDSPMTLDSDLSLQAKQFESDEESTPTKSKQTESPKSKTPKKLRDKIEEDSFLNKLVQRYGGKGKKSLRKCLEKDSLKERKGPKIIPQTNELQLLPTPSLDCIVKTPVKKDQQKQRIKGKRSKNLGKPIDFESGESIYLGYFRKKTVADFRDTFAKHNGGFATEHELPPIMLKSRTRTQTRILTQRATIREVFGDDRPASAPPLGCRNSEGDFEKPKPVTEEKETKKGLKNKILLKKRKKSVLSSGNRPGLRSAAVLRSNKAVLKSKQQLLHGVARRRRSKDLIRAYKEGKKQKKGSELKSSTEEEFLVKTELEENSIVEGNEVPNLVSSKRLNKYKGVRRKLKSSGFDYIRKKKKQQQKKEGEVEIVKEKKKTAPAKPLLESEEDIQNEIKGWVINKGHGETILHRAARLGYADVVAYCLEKMEHSPSPRDNAGYTPLHEACARSRLDIARLLLMYGADASDSAKGGIRPLHEAAESGCLEVIRLLLSYGADPLLASYSGLTPLSLTHGHPEARTLLLNHLADVQGNPAPPWQIHLVETDAAQSGYDPLAGAPSPDPSDAETEVESAELALPHLYQLRGEPPSDRYVLFQELGPILRVKTRDALVKQLGPSHRNDFRDLKMTEFYDMARCCSVLGAGDYVLNPKAHKVTLVRYSERVGELLRAEKFTVS